MFEDNDFSWDYESEFDWDKQDSFEQGAYELYEQGQMQQALYQLDLAIKADPCNSTLYFNKALTLDALDRYDQAIDCYKQALSENQLDPEIYNSLAVDYTRTGYFDLAIKTFEQAQQIDQNFEPCYCNRIITYTEMGKYDKAEEMFYLAQQIDPDCPLCFYNMGNCLFSQGQIERALWCWNRTKQLEPAHPQINYRLAQAYWSIADTDAASRHFIFELRNAPGSIDVLLDYALFLLQMNNKPSAREKLNRILELDEDSARAYHYLGEIELSDNHIEKAIDLFKTAIELADFAGPRFRLAQCYLALGNRLQAAEMIRAEFDFDIQDADVLMAMGTMMFDAEEYDLALNCFVMAGDIDSNNHLPFYYMGLSMLQTNSSSDAIHFFDYALNLQPSHIESYRKAIDCLISQKQFQACTDLICKAEAGEIADFEIRKLKRAVRTAKLKYQIRYQLKTMMLLFVSQS